MERIRYTSTGSRLAEMMDQVCADHVPIAVIRKDRGTVVMIFMEDYQALEETAYLLRSSENPRRLMQAVTELEAGKGIERELAHCGFS